MDEFNAALIEFRVSKFEQYDLFYYLKLFTKKVTSNVNIQFMAKLFTLDEANRVPLLDIITLEKLECKISKFLL